MYALLIRGVAPHPVPRNGLDMLPNFKVVICAIMFAILLFVVTGAGVVTPDSFTRIGKMPEVGRPMMQGMITDEPAQGQFQVLTLARRSGELDRLRERTALEVEVAAAQEAEIARRAVAEQPEAPDTVPASVAAVPSLQPSGAMGTAAAAVPEADAPAPPKPNTAEETAPTPTAGLLAFAALPATSADTAPPAAPAAVDHVPRVRRLAKFNVARRHPVHRTRFARTRSLGYGQSYFQQPSYGLR